MVSLPKNLVLNCIIFHAAQAITSQRQRFETIWIFLLRITGHEGNNKNNNKKAPSVLDFKLPVTTSSIPGHGARQLCKNLNF